jgi:D-3-phosphoglycerate dehydrogenase
VLEGITDRVQADKRGKDIFMSFRVLIPQDITEPGKQYLRSYGCEVKVLDDYSMENICNHVVDSDAILLRTAVIPKEVFECGKKLKVIARHGVGYDNIDLEAANQHKVQVCYTPEANAESVAEHTIALILACAKNILYMDKATRQGDWNLRNVVHPTNVSGKILGIIGFGRIGCLVAQKAALGLGMKVMVLAHHPNKNEVPDYVSICQNIEELMKTSDFLSLHAALTEETTKMIDKEKLSWMKPGAFLINTSRGAQVDEEALYEALKERTIAGAGLDVFVTEPASAKNPLFALDNVIVSPHNAALTLDSMDKMGLMAAQGIVEVLLGKKVSWPVNKV